MNDDIDPLLMTRELKDLNSQWYNLMNSSRSEFEEAGTQSQTNKMLDPFGLPHDFKQRIKKY